MRESERERERARERARGGVGRVEGGGAGPVVADDEAVLDGGLGALKEEGGRGPGALRYSDHDRRLEKPDSENSDGSENSDED